MKQIILILTFFSLTLQLTVAQDLTSIFLNIPESILFGVNAEGKDKLIANSGDSAKVIVQSSIDAEVIRDTLTDDFIKIQTSTVGTLQVKLLPLINNSKIICLVKTVCGEVCDSYVEFYATDWTPLKNTGLMPEPSIDWFIKTDVDRNSSDFKNAYAALTMIPLKIEVSADSPTLKVYCDIKNYLSEDDYKEFEPFFTDAPKSLTWDRASFK